VSDRFFHALELLLCPRETGCGETVSLLSQAATDFLHRENQVQASVRATNHEVACREPGCGTPGSRRPSAPERTRSGGREPASSG